MGDREMGKALLVMKIHHDIMSVYTHKQKRKHIGGRGMEEEWRW